MADRTNQAREVGVSRANVASTHRGGLKGFLSVLLTVCALMTFATQNNAGGDKRVVDFEANTMKPIKVGDSSVLNLLGNVVFYHNGAVITCDSAIRYNNKRMECFQNVVINQATTFIYGDRADYNGDENIAKVYAPIIKMVDKDATMYTYNFSFNTLDKVGYFSGGATIEQKENMLESDHGYYYSDTREMVCVDRVEIENPDYKIKSDSLAYNMNTELARFFVPTIIWNVKGEILSADRGSYHKSDSTYYFTKNSYVITKNQELWADSIDYQSTVEDAILRRDIQMRDEEHKVIAFGDFGQYWGAREEAFLTKNPSIVTYDPEQDSLFMRSDSMFLYTVLRSEAMTLENIAQNTSEEELIETPIAAPILPDSTSGADSTLMNKGVAVIENIAQPTQTQLEQSLDADGQRVLSRKERKRLEAEKKRLENVVKQGVQKGNAAAAVIEKSGVANELVAGLERGLASVEDSLSKVSVADDVATAAQAKADQILNDTTAVAAESKVDSMVRIVRGYRDVKIFRRDFQAACDSLVGFSIDSTMHLYIEPVLWNEANQITSDIVDVYSVNQKLDRAVFTGEPIMSSQVDSVRFNQVKGKVMESFFRDNSIYRNDVNGNGQTLYYMTEDNDGEVIITGFMVIECADITFLMENKQVEQIIYRGNPIYSMYPLGKIPIDQPQRLPGFSWEIDRRPTLKDVFDREIRESQRELYESMSQPIFPITKNIESHISRMIKDGVWRDRNDQLSPEAVEFVRTVRK